MDLQQIQLSVFSSLSRILISVNKIMNVYPIDQYSKTIPLHKLKQAQLQEYFTLYWLSENTLHERFITEQRR